MTQHAYLNEGFYALNITCLRLMCVPSPCWIKRVSGIDGFLRNTCCRINCTDLENPTAVFFFYALISELTWDAYSLATVSRSAAMQCPTHPLEEKNKKKHHQC